MRLAAWVIGLIVSLAGASAIAQRELPTSERPLQVSFRFGGKAWTASDFIEQTHASRVLLIQGGAIRLEAYAKAELPTEAHGWEARDLELAMNLRDKGCADLCPGPDGRTFYLDAADHIVLVIHHPASFVGDETQAGVQRAFIAAAIEAARQPQMQK